MSWWWSRDRICGGRVVAPKLGCRVTATEGESDAGGDATGIMVLLGWEM